MDRRGAGKTAGVEKWYLLARRKLHLIAAVSFFSLFFSYFSGYNLHFSTLIFSLFAHAIDRKYVFLLCNGILALLVKNFSFGFVKSGEDSVKQMTAVLSVGEDAASMEYVVSGVAEVEEAEGKIESESTEGETERRNVLELTEEVTQRQNELELTEEVTERENEFELAEEEDEDGDEEEVNGNVLAVEEVNDAKVSTEELNQKFEEFIRKMKEEIRVEAQQQQLVTV